MQIKYFKNKFWPNRLDFSFCCYGCLGLIKSKRILSLDGFYLHIKCIPKLRKVKLEYKQRYEDFIRGFE